MKDVELFIIVGVIITLILLAFIVSFLFVNQRRHFRYVKEKEDIRNEFSQTLLRSQLEIKEETLQHIAHEVHDNLGQIASLIKINLNMIQLGDINKSEARIADTKELVLQLIADLKSLSVNLNSGAVARLGMVKAIENEVARIRKLEQFDIALSVEGDVPDLDVNTVTIVYRMVQEILNNQLKHSRAANVSINIKAIEKIVKFTFTDDGVGFDPGSVVSKGGLGLMNLQSRAKLIDGEVNIHSTPGAGTSIIIKIPLETPQWPLSNLHL